MRKVELILDGLSCANCANKIAIGVSKIDGVKNSNLDFVTKKLKYEIDNQANENKIFEEIKRLVNKIESGVVVKSVDNDEDDEHSGEQKEELIKIILSAALLIISIFLENKTLELITVFLSYIIVGYEVIFSAIKKIIKGKPFDEAFLMTIATVGAFAIGEFTEGVAVMLFYQVGEFFQELAVNRSRKSISDLMNIRPDYANLKTSNGIEKVSPEDVKAGDIIIVKAGERIPLDGVVVSGNSSIDTAALTGEAIPRDITKNDEVLSGSINLNGVLEIEVIKEYSESTVSKILDLVENASSKKATTEKFITKFARVYTPIVVIIALLLAVIPPFAIPSAVFSDWLYRALVFLVISCPCALVISVPLSFFGGIGGASRSGILIKGANSLEALSKLEIVAFDKTGTLTEGSFSISDIKANGIDEDKLVDIIAHAESYSNHPVAKAVLSQYNKEIDKTRVDNYIEIAGKGISVLIDGKQVLAGNEKLLRDNNIDFEPINVIGTVIYTAIDNKYAGYIVVSDKVKKGSAKAIEMLKAIGIKKTVMLTGDKKTTGETVGKELKIDKVYTELLPQNKVEIVEKLLNEKSDYGTLAFVGDGINDAPVLARADVGIAMGSLGSDSAIEAADVVLMLDEPEKVASAIKISKRTMKIVIENITFALGVKLVVLALGATGHASMWAAVFADVGVSLIAILNALRALKKVK